MTPLDIRQAIERVLGDPSSDLGDVIGTYSNGDRAIQSGNIVSEQSVSGGIEVVIFPHLIGNPSKAQHYKVLLVNHDSALLMDEILNELLSTKDPCITVDNMGGRVIPHSGMNSERIELRIINALAGRI